MPGVLHCANIGDIYASFQYRMTKISDSVYQISLGFVNAFIVEADGELTLVDTGMEGSADKLFKKLRKGGKDPQQIKRIILTHCHPDHAGSAAEIQRRLNVPIYAHDYDARLIEAGTSMRAMQPSPGFLNWFLYRLGIKNASRTIQSVRIDKLLYDDDVLPEAGGLRVIHTPGHSKGHICLLLPKDRVLIAADICANMMGLDLSVVYEDLEEGIESILKVTRVDFNKAVFGHGDPLTVGASQQIRHKFSMLQQQFKQ